MSNELGAALAQGIKGNVLIPDNVEWCCANGVYIKQMLIPKKNTVVQQHVHAFDHTSMLAVGAARVWQDGELIGDFLAPHPIFIAAGIKHEFQSLVDATVIYCIHHAPDGKVALATNHDDNGAQQ